MTTFCPPMAGYMSSTFGLAVAHATSPYYSTYPWGDLGFGTKYDTTSTPLPGNGSGVAFSYDGSFIALTHASSPYVTVHNWAREFGSWAKVSDHATSPSTPTTGVAWSPNLDSIAVAGGTEVTVYQWSSSGFGAFGASAPATKAPGGDVYGVAYSPAGDYIAIAHSSSPYLSVYPWSGTAFGTKATNPATLPTGIGRAVAFTPSGNAIAVAHSASPYISVYPWSGGAFGAKYADPASPPIHTGFAVAFSPDGGYIAVANSIGTTGPFLPSEYFAVWPWSAGFGTRVSAPETATSAGTGVAFSASGDFIAITQQDSPRISVFPWSGGAFGARVSNPGTLPTGSAAGVAFNRISKPYVG